MNLQDLFRFDLKDLPLVALALIISFTVHEFAHAYSAYKFGDDTAYKAGRVTLNPAVHLDLLGSILILIAGFGWAKPVPVMASNFRKPRLMSIIVSAVGPLSNLVLGILSIFIFIILHKTGLLYAGSPGLQYTLSGFFGYMIQYSFLLFIFNLIPLPPLDGYRIVAELVPLKTRYKMEQHMQWGIIIFMLMVFIRPLREATLQPILGLGEELAKVVISIAHFIL